MDYNRKPSHWKKIDLISKVYLRGRLQGTEAADDGGEGCAQGLCEGVCGDSRARVIRAALRGEEDDVLTVVCCARML